jgi:hypothetical protein
MGAKAVRVVREARIPTILARQVNALEKVEVTLQSNRARIEKVKTTSHQPKLLGLESSEPCPLSLERNPPEHFNASSPTTNNDGCPLTSEGQPHLKCKRPTQFHRIQLRATTDQAENSQKVQPT